MGFYQGKLYFILSLYIKRKTSFSYRLFFTYILRKNTTSLRNGLLFSITSVISGLENRTIKSARKIPGKIWPKDSRTAESRITVIRIFCRNPRINLRRLQKRHRQHRFADGKIGPLLTIYLP